MSFKINITSEQIAFWIKSHFKKILFVFCIFVLAGFAFIGWNAWKKNQDNKIQDSLYELQKALNQLVEDTEEKDEKGALNLFAGLNDKKIPVFTKEMKEKASSYEEAIKQNQNSKISAVFSIDLADFYYKRGETQKAKELLSLVAFPKKPLGIYHLASFQLAAYYMDKKECEKALALLEALSLNEEASSFHLESDLQQALCLEHLNRYEQAMEKYEGILNKDPEGYIGRLAQDYKKALILSRNLKRHNEKSKSFNYFFIFISCSRLELE